jgi:hypothetical protein
MDNNFTTTELLIQFIDGELNENQADAVKKSISGNELVKEEFLKLRLSKDAIKSYGLKNRTASIHKEMMEELKQTNTPKKGVVKKMIWYTARIAAIAIIAFGSVKMYQYATVSPEKLFVESYTDFNIRESRGQISSAIENAYKDGYMDKVIQLFNTTQTFEVKDYFFAGNALLRQQQPAKAAAAFVTLQQKNEAGGTNYFEEDADYYLALSYLANKEPTKALPLFEKIHADKNSAYHHKVSAWFLFKLNHLVP